jgi:hypothetical protein
MFIPDPESEFFPSRILGQKDSRSRIRFKEFKYFNPKNSFLALGKYDPGCSSRIRILIFYFTHSGSRIQGQKDSGSASNNLSILTQKIVSKLSEYMIRVVHPESGS